MRIETGFNPNCSEAVFRFYTDQTDVARKILQAFADEVAEANHRFAQEVPQFGSMQEIGTVFFGACAGMGEPITKCIWEPTKKAFVLCIGNNDLAPDGSACQTVRELGIKVEEAETCEDLQKYARDCTCGIIFFQEPVPADRGGVAP